MTQLTPTAESEPLAALPRLPRDEGGPVFAEPWQAQAFALAVKLSEQGHFTWKEWAAALADELQAAARRGEPDDGSRYYEHWLAALESWSPRRGWLIQPSSLHARKPGPVHTETLLTASLSNCQSSATSEARWLLLGLACTVGVYWILQYATVAPGEWVALPPVGFAASAGLGTLLGIRHALEPDHLAAVTTLMTGERSTSKAAWLGAWWGLGHTLTLLITGGLLVVSRAEMPAIAAQVFELCVVLLLVGFGMRAIYQGACRLSVHPTHSHRRAGAFSPFKVDRWTVARPLVVGAVHGLAGSGALTALVVTTLPSTVTRLAYLTLFGIGTIAGMVVLSGLLGWPMARLGNHRVFTRAISLVVGSVSTALGLFWFYPLIEGLF